MTGIVIYASKYGSTAEYARLMAQRLGTEGLEVPGASLEKVWDAGYVVLGSPIYGDSVLPSMERFLLENREAMAGKPLAAFVVCGDTLWNSRAGEGGHRNLAKLTRFLPAEPFATVVLGGRMQMVELDHEDGPRIRAFYERIGREATGFDRMELEKVEPFVKEIKERIRAQEGRRGDEETR